MISNLEYEFKRLKKLTKKLLTHSDLEFTLPKRISEVENLINIERTKYTEMTKQSKMYDKEI